MVWRPSCLPTRGSQAGGRGGSPDRDPWGRRPRENPHSDLGTVMTNDARLFCVKASQGKSCWAGPGHIRPQQLPPLVGTAAHGHPKPQPEPPTQASQTRPRLPPKLTPDLQPQPAHSSAWGLLPAPAHSTRCRGTGPVGQNAWPQMPTQQSLRSLRPGTSSITGRPSRPAPVSPQPDGGPGSTHSSPPTPQPGRQQSKQVHGHGASVHTGPSTGGLPRRRPGGRDSSRVKGGATHDKLAGPAHRPPRARGALF